MPRYDFKSPRLYVPASLKAGQKIELDRNQANYLLNVLRLKQNDTVLIFNGIDGEWLAEIGVEGRKKATLTPLELQRIQPAKPDLHYLFAPLKQARQDYMIQKAVEMGAGLLQPVLTQYTQIRKVNEDRMKANAIEATEQCGILNLPETASPLSLEHLITRGFDGRTVIFCDEEAAGQNPIDALRNAPSTAISVLIGPEGGFSQSERTQLHALDNVIAIPLGPRVLRADTAAVAALAIVQSVLGDWRDNPK